MLKVMIVDDEEIFREFLKILLPWEDYGFEIRGEARNGVEALELSERLSPDIAIIDINMPFMDGLELSERLKAEFPDIGIIIISGHNEFDYARRAIKLGVKDYVLKPFTKEEMLLTLLKIQSEIKAERETQLTLKANEVRLREAFFNLLVENGHIDEEEARLKLAEFGFPPITGRYKVACIEIDQMDEKWRKANDREIWKFAVKNVLSETIRASGNHIVFNGTEGRIICIYEEEEAGGNFELAQVREGYEQLCLLVKKYLKFEITIGLGTIRERCRGIRESYHEALQALRYKFIIGTDRLIAYDDGVEGVKGFVSGFIPSETNEELLMLLRLCDSDGLQEKINAIFVGIREERISIDYVYTICMGLISICLSCVSEKGHPIEDCFGEEFYPYSDIMQQKSIADVEHWITELYVQAVYYMGCHKKTKSRKIAEAAKQLIDEHYMDSELRVESIARQVYINPSYLRAIFKKVHGMTVGNYITQQRMQYARSQLMIGQYKLSDIAERAGFQDPAYFSRAFKRFYGYSPSDYENMRR
jgi:two-component system response regulator YesN